MNTYAEMIYQEIQRLPEPLVREVYDFLRFIEARHSIRVHDQNAVPDWKTFFERHTRIVEDGHPMRRDELYADRLR